ncbi:hypothetical protein [Nesterenkonia xinjiangensis]|uniref:Uncharacterized protein n=1 Tax=Nesterenkonia xinjiangensis TaxID=225327 RepID=A0A7Z0GJL5_9MICC|nr:hypothetical protein [Nesterenkonia xinjiangensis]NYJ77189.1 hypothetical protein [Nesterenkonia xinjiangensis]
MRDLRLRSTHIENKLHGAQLEIQELGELGKREAERPVMQRLFARVRDDEHKLSEVDVALALAEQRLDSLKEKPGWSF